MAGPPSRKRQRSSVARRSETHALERDGVDSDGDAIIDDIVASSDADEEVPMSSEEEELETAEEKRVRLAKEFLGRVEAMEGSATFRRHGKERDEEEDESGKGDDEFVQKHLQESSRAARGILHRRLAASISSPTPTTLRGHRRSATCVDLSSDDSRAFSCSKDGSWIAWDMETQSKIFVGGPKESDQLLACCISPDGQVLATGGVDRAVRLWDTRAARTPVHTFTHLHRDTITCLAWRRGSPQLFSGSLDRTVTVWDVEARAYTDTLFGHQSPVMSLSSLAQERVLSCGLDGTIRLFKVAEQTQLVFRGKTTNIDTVAMLSEAQFISGDQSGAISVFRTGKKKPIGVIPEAHGAGCWISSVAACPYTDMVASGASDGYLRLWQVSPERITVAAEVPIAGFLNSIKFARSGRFAVCAVGQEPRLGRWTTVQKARNGINIVNLGTTEPVADDI
ncbi:WD domain, G-beta repeat [Plasmodiophora brassicae]|uniref:Uncharacterized protein n=1 Tax=Plasmodiophora brassicae TaxID=37360 RepID=A0A0G4IZ70_PLABS|nr:hypothetical protein PBRA_001405 [Plasmodiophora brassicae]SPQ94140.1 unnamed protein product [Plasmodiophora brassicae]